MVSDIYISIHALLAESDHHLLEYLYLGQQFLSTLSLRRATFNPLKAFIILTFLSTLSLRRATIQNAGAHLHILISIHALLAESDIGPLIFSVQPRKFLSTLSLRRATGCVRYCIHARVISIHALLAESDLRPEYFLT